MTRTLLVDADDTLWENITVFNAVNAAYVDWLLPGSSVQELQSELDALQVEFIAEHGYGRETFAKSLLGGVEQFVGRTPSDADRAVVAELVRPLQWDELDLIDGVHETLEELSARNRLIMVTKGDHDEQSHKVARSGLRHHFDAIEILPTKSVSEYERIGELYSLDPATTWMIGNSPRSDIHPALEVGFGAIHIPHAETWSHEREDLTSHPRLMSLGTFSELVRHF